MPFRLEPEYPGRAKIQFTTSAEMPHLIYQACLVTGTVSNTVYCQHAVADALARDLGLDRQELENHLPTPRGKTKSLWDRPDGHVYAGPANTIEDVHDTPR